MESAPPVTDRHLWVDVAKGLTMVLVVLSHVVYKHYVPLEGGGDLPWRRGWIELSEFFAPMRMPLFLLLSGFLAAGAIHRSWQRSLPRRAVNPYGLYLLWFAINAAFLAAFGFAGAEDLELSPRGLAQNLLFPRTTLWYMVALVVAFLVAYALRSRPIVAVSLAALVSAATWAQWVAWPAWTGMWESIARFTFLFVVGALLPGAVHRAAAVRDRTVIATTFAAYIVAALSLRSGAGSWAGVGPATSLVGAMSGVLVSTWLTRRPRPARPLAVIGRRTLPIFVLHIPTLAVLHWVATGPAVEAWRVVLARPLTFALYPIVACAVAIVVPMGIHAGLQRLGLPWLFALPIGRGPRPAGSRAAPPRT